MVEGAFIVLAASFIDGVQIVSQARTIRNQETQGTYAVAGIDITGETDANSEEACLLMFSILPTLANFGCNGRSIRVAPLEFEGDVGCAPFVAVGCGRFGTTEDIVFHMSFATTEGVETIGTKVTIECEG